MYFFLLFCIQNRQPGGRKRQFGCQGHQGQEKVREGHRGRQTIENQL